ncbi:hypothetical protein E3N88_00184 [Mikania micrantha]|uniref:Uncharacterized protein n=1 Tax=Mikania micrantha TaxID=192012 RepID=A0A5N6PZG1_9ASTR|nr:hypothetical protein E3N88_00184 [Mikania micrantha]
MAIRADIRDMVADVGPAPVSVLGAWTTKRVTLRISIGCSLIAVSPLEISQLSGGIDHYANDEIPSTLNVRPLNNSQLSGIDEYDASAQPLSTRAVRPSENSQISDAVDHYASSQPSSAGAIRQLNISQLTCNDPQHASVEPPSTGDVRPSDDSQTGNPVSDSNVAAVMSLIAPKFKLRRFHPNVFQIDNNEC